jgi:hypothetical protein
MPSFTPDDFDIEPGEFVDSCNTRERDELINALVEDGYITESQRNKRVEGSIGKPNMQDTIFWESLDHLKKCRDLLSIHEENYINNMAHKYKHLR